MKDHEKDFLEFQKQEAVLKSARETVRKWLELVKTADDLAENMVLQGYTSSAQHVEAAARRIKSMVPVDDLAAIGATAKDNPAAENRPFVGQ